MTLPYSLRPATDADREWMRRLRHTVYRDVVERQFGWDQAWQDDYFERTFDPARSQIVQVGGRDAGVICIERRSGEVFLAEIEIDPEYQGQGLGTNLIRDVLRQAQSEGLPVTLRVLLLNDRARALYEHLGFVLIGQTETHDQMRWTPADTGSC